MLEVTLFKFRVVQQPDKQCVQTNKTVQTMRLDHFNEHAWVTRVRDQDAVITRIQHRHQVNSERVYVVQRQRSYYGSAVGWFQWLTVIINLCHVGARLQHVRNQVQVGQLSALRNTCSTTGVLQNDSTVVTSDVVLLIGTRRLTQAQRFTETHSGWQRVIRDHFLDVFSSSIDQLTLREWQHVCKAGHDNVLQARFWQDALYRFSEHVHAHQGFRT